MKKKQLKKKVARNQEDTAWKELLKNLFKNFMDYCLPDLSALIDWSKPYAFLDKALQAIEKKAMTGKRFIDKLFHVSLLNGQKKWIYLHLEIQASLEDDFSKRMFVYAYRIWDKYQENLLSCAVLTDKNPDWRPDHYETQFLDFY